MDGNAGLVFQELHEYARTELRLYIFWFLLFLTVLEIAMAWSIRASLDGAGRLVAPFPFYCVVALFSLQIVCGMVATAAVAGDLREADRAGQTLLASAGPAGGVAVNPFPQGLHGVMVVTQATLVSNFAFWLVVAYLVYRRRGQQLAGGPAA